MENVSLKIKSVDPDELVKKINIILSEYLPQIYSYNNLIRDKKYYLKPVHIVTKKKPDGNYIKYYYYGRYWYRIERRRDKPSRIKWIYLGKDKPEPDLPEPPENPLEGLVVKISKEGVEIITSKKETYRLIYEALASSQYRGEEAQAL